MPSWLWKTELVDVPLFISHRTLMRYKTLKPAVTTWALDAGGFTELAMHGEWTISPYSYIGKVRRYWDEIGSLDWIAPQDWMCEPHMLAKTGLTVTEHQKRTIDSVCTLRTLSPELPIVPVLQGWTRDDYMRHVDMYAQRGFDLESEPTVGLGSICRRQATQEAAEIAASLQPIKLHAFGAKRDAIGLYGSQLQSADSMAWSFTGRYNPDPTCTKKTCANCLHYALEWRRKAMHPDRVTLWGLADV